MTAWLGGEDSLLDTATVPAECREPEVGRGGSLLGQASLGAARLDLIAIMHREIPPRNALCPLGC